MGGHVRTHAMRQDHPRNRVAVVNNTLQAWECLRCEGGRALRAELRHLWLNARAVFRQHGLGPKY